MPRNIRILEAGIMAGVLVSGCVGASEPDIYVPIYGSGSRPPESVDYMMAVQCGSLLWAVWDQDWKDPLGSASRPSVVGVYVGWAEELARRAGHHPALALRDIAASRQNILESAGVASLASIKSTHAGEEKACRSTATAAEVDIVMIGG
jgi:hypothetical protein